MSKWKAKERVNGVAVSWELNADGRTYGIMESTDGEFDIIDSDGHSILHTSPSLASAKSWFRKEFL